jgi:ribosomal protein L23
METSNKYVFKVHSDANIKWCRCCYSLSL